MNEVASVKKIPFKELRNSTSVLSDYDILTNLMGYSEEDALTMLNSLNQPKSVNSKKDFETELKEEILKEANKFVDKKFTTDNVYLSTEAVQDTYIRRVLEAKSYKPRSSDIRPEEIAAWKEVLEFIDGKLARGCDLTGPLTGREVQGWLSTWEHIRDMDIDKIREKVTFLDSITNTPLDPEINKPYRFPKGFDPNPMSEGYNYWDDRWLYSGEEDYDSN